MPFWSQFRSILAPLSGHFGSILCQELQENANTCTWMFTFFIRFRVHCYSMLAPFCVHFNVILGPFGVFGGSRGGGAKTSKLCLDFGVPLGSPWTPFLIKTRYFFQLKNAALFLSILDGLLAPFWEPLVLHFASKNVPGTKKVIFSKWASRVHESSIFEGRDPQNPSKKHPKMH